MLAKALIFDLDGLMLDTESIARAIWMREAELMSLPIDAELYSSLIGRTYADISATLEKAFHGKADAAEYIDRCLSHYRARILDPIPTMPGLPEMLDYCDAHGLLKAVGTSSGRSMAEIKLRSGGIEGRFDAMLTGSDVAKGKPDPEIFLKCAEKLGLEPSECVVLEDSPNGVIAGRAAGMRVVMIPNLIQPDERVRAAADQVLESLADLPEYMEKQGWVGVALKR